MSGRATAFLILGLVGPGCAGDRGRSPSEAVRGSATTQDWWSAVKQWIAQDQRNAHVSDDGSATLATADLRLLADGSGTTVRAKGAAWRFTLARVEREHGAALLVAPAAPEAAEARVTYRRHGVTEWYQSRGRAVEQGFSVERLDGVGDLLVVGEVTSAFRPVPARDGFRYGPLLVGGVRAVDAAGRCLRAALQAGDASLAVRVAAADVRTARWPITIDPVLQVSPVWEYSAPSTSAFGNPLNLGVAVAGVGDVINDDGYADLIVGEPGFEVNAGFPDIGKILVFAGSATGFGSTPAWQDTVPGGFANAHFGASVAGAGDVNGDGVPDLIVGAPGMSASGQLEAGRAYVYYGGGAAPTGPTEITAEPQAMAHFGAAVAGAGDVDGDGRADVLVGAPDYDGGAPDSGRAYLFRGGLAGVAAVFTWSATPDPQAGAHFASALAGAGDVDGDGLSDVVIGAPDHDAGDGRAYVFRGIPAGLSAAPDWTLPDVSQVQGGERLGAAVASGDANGDGLSDILLGAPDYDDTFVDSGRAALYLWSATGPAVAPEWAATPGAQASAHFGAALAGIGDADGDGLADFLAGAPQRDGADVDAGGATLLIGDARPSVVLRVEDVATPSQAGATAGAAVAGAGDADGDGFSDIVVGAPAWDETGVDDGRALVFYGGSLGLSAAPDLNLNPDPQNGANLGFSVASAGDVNGDGFADVVVGAPGYDFTQTGSGRAYLFLGGSSGLATTAAWAETPEPEGGAQFGWAVAGAGFVNGDDFADVAVGAPRRDVGSFADAGKVYVFHGSAAGLDTVPDWALDAPEPEDSGRFGNAVGGSDVNGDGFGDVLVGAPGDEMLGTSFGRAYVFTGSAVGLPAFNCATQCIANPEPQLGAEFGAVIVGAGDLNGDGYGDVAIGAPYWDLLAGQNDHGRMYVYYGTQSRLSAAASLRTTAEPDEGARFAWAIADAGDVDGDGYSDLVVGAPDQDVASVPAAANQGRMFLYRGGILGVKEPPSQALTADPTTDSNRFGYALAGAGDTDGDGLSDVAAGSRLGRGYLFRGTPAGADGSADWTFASSNGFGEALAGVDADGDGFSDLVVGSFAENSLQGSVYLFSGNDEGSGGRQFPPAARLAQVDGNNVTIRVGGPLGTATLHLDGVVTNASWLGARARLQVEVRRVGEPFAGTPSAESPPGAAGTVLRATLAGLDNGAYRWRARAVWPERLGAGRWVEFGSNDPAEADFRVGFPNPPDNQGTACTVNSQCSSRFCRDGVCCNLACEGICQRCSATGQCTAVESGDPENECPADLCHTGDCGRGGGCGIRDPGTPCGTCLVCDDTGQCAMPVTGGGCGPDQGPPEPADMGSPEPDVGPGVEPMPEPPPDMNVVAEAGHGAGVADPFACNCGVARHAAPPWWFAVVLVALLLGRPRPRRAR
jgi:FG-GAP repeat protein